MKIVSYILLIALLLGISMPVAHADFLDLDFDFDYSPKHYGSTSGYGTYPYHNSYLSYGGYGGVPFGYYEVPFDSHDAMSPFLADKVFGHMDAQPLVPYHFQQQNSLFSFLNYQQPCAVCSYYN